MNVPLSTLASRALNAPSEAEYSGPSRAFLVQQAVLNVHPAAFWREWWDFFEPDMTDLRKPLYVTRKAIIAEFNKLAIQYARSTP